MRVWFKPRRDTKALCVAGSLGLLSGICHALIHGELNLIIFLAALGGVTIGAAIFWLLHSIRIVR